MTVQQYAIVDDTTGAVVNRVLWDGQSDWVPSDGTHAVADPNNALPATPPVPVVPSEIPAWKARALLSQMPSPKGTGHTFLADADAALEAIGGVGLIAWQGAPTFSRTGALMQQVTAAFGLTGEQVDALFAQADQITV